MASQTIQRARWCRICGGEVIDPEAWVDLPRLGRFWMCPRHSTAFFTETAHVGYLASFDRGPAVVLGPYPYEVAP